MGAGCTAVVLFASEPANLVLAAALSRAAAAVSDAEQGPLRLLAHVTAGPVPAGVPHGREGPAALADRLAALGVVPVHGTGGAAAYLAASLACAPAPAAAAARAGHHAGAGLWAAGWGGAAPIAGLAEAAASMEPAALPGAGARTAEDRQQPAGAGAGAGAAGGAAPGALRRQPSALRRSMSRTSSGSIAGGGGAAAGMDMAADASTMGTLSKVIKLSLFGAEHADGVKDVMSLTKTLNNKMKSTVSSLLFKDAAPAEGEEGQEEDEPVANPLSGGAHAGYGGGMGMGMGMGGGGMGGAHTRLAQSDGEALTLPDQEPVHRRASDDADRLKAFQSGLMLSRMHLTVDARVGASAASGSPSAR
jgi:hypothetical protein